MSRPEVAMSCDDVVCLFFLSEFVSISSRETFSVVSRTSEDVTNASVHSREQSPTKYAGNTKHMEWMHKNIMLRLEDEHVIKRAGLIPRGIASEKEPCPKGYTKNTAASGSDWS